MGYCYGLAGYGNGLLGGFWWVMPLLFWGLVITGIVLAFRSHNRRDRHQALNVLKHQYALGNITRDEFMTRKKDLQ